MISIIVPTLNRQGLLEKTLESILANDRKGISCEVIVVDNGSTDGTAGLVSRMQEADSSIRYIFDNEPGLLTGRHRGYQEAKGDVLVYLDDDVHLNDNYLQTVQAAFADPSVIMATGPCLPLYHTYPPAWLDYFWIYSPYGGKYCSWLSLLDFGNREIDVDPNFVWGLNFIIRKDKLKELGGFHPDCIPSALQHFQGDGETGLTMKAISLGYRAIYRPGLMLYHHVTKERLTMAYFKKRAYYQGVCNAFTMLRAGQGQKQQAAHNHRYDLVPDIMKGYLRRLKKLAAKKREKHIIPQEIQEMFFLLQKEELAGFDFLQWHYAENEAVRLWVHKPAYWDYKLPPVQQQALNQS